MNKKQNKLRERDLTPRQFYIVITFIIIFCSLVLIPKVTSSLFSLKRQSVLKSFLSHVTKSHRIDFESFWEFREFYSPGTFVLSQYYLDPIHTTNITYPESFPVISGPALTPFAQFTSPHVFSVDSLTSSMSLAEYIDTSKLAKYTQLFHNDTSGIYEHGAEIYIIFITSEADMEKTNGFFDYGEKDKKRVEGKYWLDITRIER